MVKLITLLIILPLYSCSFYMSSRYVEIKGVSRGYLMIKSVNGSYSVQVENSEVLLSLHKGLTYFITNYRFFGDDISRYPYGAVVYPHSQEVSLDNKVGVLTSVICESVELGHLVDEEILERISNMILTKRDPWRYSREDLISALMGYISPNAISMKRRFIIDELGYLDSWECENPLREEWYPSLLRFYKDGELFRLNILDDGSYTGF